MNLATAFAASALQNREKPAVFWGDNKFSYAHFLAQSAVVAHELRVRFGVQPGDRVGLWLRNRPEFISAVFGVLGAGAVLVPINNFLKPDEVGFILGDAGIDVLITEAQSDGLVAQLAVARPTLRAFRVEDWPVAGEPGSVPFAESPADRLAVIIYTSGTTGHPKGAMLTHANLLHNVASCREVLETVQADRFALVLPMFHSFMLTVCVLLPLLVGGSIVLIESLHPPKSLLQEIIRHEATILPGIPPLFRALAHVPPPPGLALRICVSGSAPLPVETLRAFSAHFAVPLLEGYGLSEASPVVALNPLHAPSMPGSIGRPVAGVEVSVRDDRGMELPDGQAGELCVRGGNVMVGYWNQPEETAQALRDGWLYTGDVGYRRADGYFFITDRKKDMLLVNGNNVYSREIEEVIYLFPGVREAAVVGRPDSRRGEQPVAFVAMNDGVRLEEAALIQFLRERLADYKLPRRVIALPGLPRNATGKILKTALRRLPV